jgi:hypothetical protein
MKNFLFGLGGIIITIGVACAFMIEFALNPACDLIELNTRSSPDGKFITSVFRKNCGATTDYVTGVTLRREGQPFNDESANTVLIIDGIASVKVLWVAVNALEISVPSSARVVRRNDKWNDIDLKLMHRDGT